METDRDQYIIQLKQKTESLIKNGAMMFIQGDITGMIFITNVETDLTSEGMDLTIKNKDYYHVLSEKKNKFMYFPGNSKIYGTT